MPRLRAISAVPRATQTQGGLVRFARSGRRRTCPICASTAGGSGAADPAGAGGASGDRGAGERGRWIVAWLESEGSVEKRRHRGRTVAAAAVHSAGRR